MDLASITRERLTRSRSEEHTSELQSQSNLVCRLLLEKQKVRDSHPNAGLLATEGASQLSGVCNPAQRRTIADPCETPPRPEAEIPRAPAILPLKVRRR